MHFTNTGPGAIEIEHLHTFSHYIIMEDSLALSQTLPVFNVRKLGGPGDEATINRMQYAYSPLEYILLWLAKHNYYY